MTKSTHFTQTEFKDGKKLEHMGVSQLDPCRKTKQNKTVINVDTNRFIINPFTAIMSLENDQSKCKI